MLDWKITGGTVLDGTGAPGISADVGIQGARITALGHLAGHPARHTLDAAGLLVCPGFIDAHSHSDAYLLIEPSAPSKVFQGITTEIIGNCGASAAPIRDRGDLPSDWADQAYPCVWHDFRQYLAALESARPAVNTALLVGHGNLRKSVMGQTPRQADAGEIRRMAALLHECLDAGAIGLSSGLLYPPGRFAGRAELHALAAVVARHDGVYATHMRNEGPTLPESIAETLAVGRATGVRLQISHLKTAGRKNWHHLDAVLTAIRDARQHGLQVAADRYPYTSGCTELDVILPEWAAGGGRPAVLQRLRDPDQRARIHAELLQAREPGDWENIIIGSTAAAAQCGKPLAAIAASKGLDPAETALRLMDADELRTVAFFAGMSEDNMWRILSEPYVMAGTDASLRAPCGPLGQDHPHPRAYGAFPRLIKAALAGRISPLPETIRKMTSLPACHFRLRERGRLSAGYMADITVFDPALVDDPADYIRPHRLSSGMRMVMVNGVPVLDHDGLTGARPGSIASSSA